MYDYPEIIKKQPNGSYTWSCSIEVSYFRRNMGLGFKACLLIAAFIFVYGLILSVPSRDWKSFLVVTGCIVVFLLITILVFGLTLLAKDPQEIYEMTEIYVKTGSGRSSAYFNFEKARTAVFSPKYIELQGKIARMRVYAPEEDFDFVKSYIRSRLSAECEIRYEY